MNQIESFEYQSSMFDLVESRTEALEVVLGMADRLDITFVID